MSKGPSDAEKQAMRQLSQEQMKIMQQLAQQQRQLFGQGAGLFGQGLGFYQALMSGDRPTMLSALAPAVRGYDEQTRQVLSQIFQQMPRSGTQQLAAEQARTQQAASIGNLLTQAYTGAFPSVMQAGMSELGYAPQYAFGASQAGSVAGQTLGQLAQAEAMGGAAKAEVLSRVLGSAGYLGGIAMGAPVL
jgi:hypothetical protein